MNPSIKLSPVKYVLSLFALTLLQVNVRAQAPSIGLQSPSSTVIAGQTIAFSAGVNGNPSPTCQWQASGDGGRSWSVLADGGGYSGTATPTLTIGSAALAMSGMEFRLVASNVSGSTPSAPVSLTVTPFVSDEAIAFDFALVAGAYGQSGHADGTGAAANFSYPVGVAADLAGNLYVVDNVSNCIRKISRLSEVSTLAGGQLVPNYDGLLYNSGSNDGPGATAHFNSPYGVAVDSFGNVYVADTGNSTIRKITPDGTVSTLAGSAGINGSADGAGSSARFFNPQGITIDSRGNIYVADTGNQTIRRVTTAGVVSTVAGAAQAVGSADGAGAAARFYEPTAIAVDAAGDLFVADSSNCTIRKITPTGTVSTLAGSPGVTGSADGVGNAARFSLPLGVAVDPAGNIYVADYANATIRRITPSGVVTTVGGIAGQTGDVDGTGSLVQFNSPAGVAVDGAGVLYIADAGDDLVRMGSPVAVFPIAVAASPQNETVSAGQEASFAAAASSAANLSYRWQIWPVGGQGWSDLSDGGMYQGTATPTLSVGPATAGLGGAQFRCVVRNAGVTTATGAATLDVVYLAETEQSSSTGFIAGRPAAFAAGFIGYPAPNYQWQESTDGGYSWTNLADGNGLNGSATSTLGLTAVATSLSGVQFRALVSNAAGSQTSTPVTMAVFSQPTADTVTFDFSAVAGSYLADGSANGIGAAAQFSQPSAIGADAAGNLYVVDGGDSANSVRKIAPDGTVTTLAGTPGLSGYLDGPAASALFGSIGGIAVDPAGDVYVSDNGSMTIRKISALGTVTTIAGTPFLAGYQDGIGKTAEFSSPKGLALDSSGNLFVADSLNYVVRKVTPGGAVTTFAGNGSAGSSDGIPGQFSVIYGLAIDQAGNVYVADYGNATIRKITPGGNVVTLAGTTGVLGHVDGAGAAAEFGFLSQLASDGAGNLYATDSYAGQNTGFNYASVRMITAAGVVTTLTGLVGNTVHSSSSYGNGIASTALFAGPAGVAVDPAGNLYVTDDGFVAKGFPTPIGPIPIMPVIVTQPTTQTLTAGSSGTLSVLATGEPAFAYQWLFDGSPIAGANAPSLTLSQVGTTQAGAYSVEVMDGAGMATSASVDVAVTSAARLTNLSARAWIAPKVNPANVLIGGFGITGDTPKSLLIRAVGPGLESLNVQGFLPNPTLTFHSGSFTGPILTGWDQSLATVFAELGAFQLAVGSADVAVLQTTGAGSYTEVLTPADNSTSGIALAEIYDADQGTPVSRLVNLSARAWVGTGSQVLIGGFAVAGSSSETVLIRAVGPSLQNLNITNYLPNPSVQIFDDNPTQRPDGPQLIASTGNGAVPIPGPSPVSAGFQPATADLMTRLGAFQLNSGSTDRALVVTLPPGSYTVMIQGIFGETGVALLELYEVLPP